MRILGRLPHPDMQITVFSNDGRFPVQFERGGLTQQYRFRHGPTLAGFGDVAALIDEAFTTKVIAIFNDMQRVRNGVIEQHLSPDTEADLPNII